MQDAPPALLAASFQLSYFSAAQEGYVEVPLQAVMLDSISAAGGTAGAVKTLLLIGEEEEAAAAAEWEVCWELPAAASAAAPTAAAVLRHLRVNPRPCSAAAAAAVAGLGRQVRLPPPLAASLTVVLTAEGGSLALLAPAPLLPVQGQHKQQHPHHQQHQPHAAAATAAALLDTVAVLHAGSLKAAVHTYPSAPGGSQLAVDLSATLALCLPDSSSATAPAGTEGASAPGWALIEPFELDAAVEVSGGGSGDGTPALHEQLSEAEVLAAGEGTAGEQQQLEQQLALPLFWQGQQGQELPLLAVRRPPRRPGLAVLLAAQGHPLVVNASEGGLAEVNRLLAVLASPGSDSGVRNGEATEGSGARKGQAREQAAGQATSEAAAAATAAAPLLLVNSSGLDLRVRQEGAAGRQLLLRQGQRLPLVWPAPPALVPGATRRLQLAAAGAAEDDQAAWSAPVDVGAGRAGTFFAAMPCWLVPACFCSPLAFQPAWRWRRCTA